MAKPAPPGLQKAIELAGNRVKLARKLGCTPMTITQWCNRGVPAERAKQIEDVFSGAVTREEVRPDLFGGLGNTSAA